MIPIPRFRSVGMGVLSQSGQTAAGIAAAGASLTGIIIGSMLAIPIAGPIAAGIAAVGVAIANAFGGCGNTCVAATQIANKVQQLLQQNLDTYMGAPIHYASLQAAAVNNAQMALDALEQGCSDPNLGAAGRNCISERLVRGGTAPWCPSSDHRGCDWLTTYLDPIANDPHVVPDPSPISSGALSADASTVLTAFGVNPSSTVMGIPLKELALPALLILGALLL